jgi:hypothetical protein
LLNLGAAMKLKTCHFHSILLAFALLPIAKTPAETAWQALDILKSERGAGVIGNVTQVRGHRGQDQPAAWEIVTRIADGERVFVAQDGKIIADTVYSSGGGVTIDTRRLRIDSREAFRIANQAATTSKISFDAIDYELRAASGGNAPLWVIYLRDSKGKDVAELEIAGEDGRILKQSWFAARSGDREPIGKEDDPKKRAVRTYPAEGSPAVSDASKGVGKGAVIARTTSGLDSAGGRMKEGFRSIGSSFGKIFKGEAIYHTRRDARYQRPGTVKRIGR